MAVYVVINQEPGQSIKDPVRAAYPLASEFWSDSVGFIYTKDRAKEIATKIGVAIYDNDKKVISGNLTRTLICELSQNYFGAGPNSTWRWITAAFDEDRAND